MQNSSCRGVSSPGVPLKVIWCTSLLPYPRASLHCLSGSTQDYTTYFSGTFASRPRRPGKDVGKEDLPERKTCSIVIASCCYMPAVVICCYMLYASLDSFHPHPSLPTPFCPLLHLNHSNSFLILWTFKITLDLEVVFWHPAHRYPVLFQYRVESLGMV